MTNIKLSKKIKQISYEMFHSCRALVELNIPEGVTYIGAGGIANCSALKKLVIPSTLNSISDNVFYGSNSIEEINIKDGSGFVYENGS